MPAFDLRGIRIGEYKNTGGTVSYTGHTSMGDAMNVNIELKYAEGRLYAESKLAEYMKLATGGTISVGVKYIPDAAQKILFGATEKSRTPGSSTAVKGLQFTTKDIGKYVGLACYAPDQIDGTTKYTCLFVSKVLFGPPAMVYQTKGDSITFQTPTTTGEFLADDSTAQTLIETASVATEAEAIAWTKLVLGES